MSWPGHIKDVGGIRHQFHHVIDIVPTILEATGIPAARHDQRHQAAPDRRREHGLHVGQGERQRPHPAHHAILRDARQSRHLSRRLGGGDDAGDHSVGTEHQAAAGRDHRLQMGTLQRQGGPHRGRRPRRQDAGQAQGDAGPLLRRGEEVQRAAARQLDAGALQHAAPEPDGGPEGVHLFGRTDRRAGQRAPRTS